MSQIENTLREAGRQRRRVRIRFQYQGEQVQEYEREYEPYAIRDGQLVAFSYFRDEFRTLPLGDILDVEPQLRTFSPRRAVEL